MERDSVGRILHRARPGAGAPPGPAPAAAASALPRSAAGRGRGGRRRESLTRAQASMTVGNLIRRRSVSRQYLESPTARPSRPAASSRGLGDQEAGVHRGAEELLDGDDHQENEPELPLQQLDDPQQAQSTLPLPITRGERKRKRRATQELAEPPAYPSSAVQCRRTEKRWPHPASARRCCVQMDALERRRN